MWELDYKESWVLKNWYFWAVVFEKTLESPLGSRRSNQSIIKEISLEYSLKGLMLKLKLQYQSLLKLTSIKLVMPSSHLILCHNLLLLPTIPSSIRVFSNESTLRMRWSGADKNIWQSSKPIYDNKNEKNKIDKNGNCLNITKTNYEAVFQ